MTSDAAPACQKNGWKTLRRSDGTAFKSQDDCVSYGARDGPFFIVGVCLDSSSDFADARVVGAPNALDNVDFYFSVDGTCTGGVRRGGYETVIAGTEADDLMIRIKRRSAFIGEVGDCIEQPGRAFAFGGFGPGAGEYLAVAIDRCHSEVCSAEVDG